MRMAGGQRQWLNELPNDLQGKLPKAEVDLGTAEMARWLRLLGNLQNKRRMKELNENE